MRNSVTTRVNTEENGKDSLEVRKGGLILKPYRYTLNELLARGTPSARRSNEEREWLDDKAVGKALI